MSALLALASISGTRLLARWPQEPTFNTLERRLLVNNRAERESQRAPSSIPATLRETRV